MVLRLLSLTLACLVLCCAPQAPDRTVVLSSSFTTGQSELLAADAAPQPELQEVGGAHAPDHQHAQWHNEEADDPQVLLRTLPGEPSALLGRDCHGPFVGSVLRAPYLDGLLRPPSLARLT